MEENQILKKSIINYKYENVKNGTITLKMYSEQMRNEILPAIKYIDKVILNSIREKIKQVGFSDSELPMIKLDGEPYIHKYSGIIINNDFINDLIKYKMLKKEDLPEETFREDCKKYIIIKRTMKGPSYLNLFLLKKIGEYNNESSSEVEEIS